MLDVSSSIGDCIGDLVFAVEISASAIGAIVIFSSTLLSIFLRDVSTWVVLSNTDKSKIEFEYALKLFFL